MRLIGIGYKKPDGARVVLPGIKSVTNSAGREYEYYSLRVDFVCYQGHMSANIREVE